MTGLIKSLPLAEFASSGVLDSASELAFDSVVQAAVQIAGCRTALVSFLDSDRQWFHARFGMDLTHVARETGLCEHVLAANAPLVVPDATADVRFARNPLVIGPHGFRFYAGFPLRTASGAVLGALCVLDDQVRPEGLTEGQISLLSLLADQVMLQLELRRSLAQRDITVQELEASRKRYRALADEGTEVVSQHALDGRTLYVSPAVADILGYDPDIEIGITVLDRLHPQDAPKLERAVRAVVRGLPTAVLIRTRHVDGTWRHLDVQLSPVRDVPGQVVEIHSVARDVSDRKSATERLRLSEERLRALFENKPIGQIEVSPQEVLERVNQAFADLVGLTASQLIDLTSGWSAVAMAERNRVLGNGETLTRPEGAELDVAVDVVVGAQSNRQSGEMRQLAHELAAARDEAVRRNALTDTVLDTVNVGIIACDAEGLVTRFNRTARSMFGTSVETDPGCIIWDDRFVLFAEDGKTPFPQNASPLFRALTEGAVEDLIVVIAPVDLPTRVVRCDGRALHDLFGTLLGAVVVMTDVTQARVAARGLAEQAAFARVLLETTHSAIWACDASGALSYHNQAAQQFLEWPQEALVGQGWRFYGLDGRELSWEELPLWRALTEGEVGEVELLLASPGGERRSLLVHASAIRDANGVVMGSVATGYDVSELRASEARFRATFRDGPTPVARLNGAGMVLEVNPALGRLLGMLGTRLAGVDLKDHTHPEDRERLQRVLQGPGTGTHPVELRFLRADGTAIWCELATTAANGPDGYVLAQLLDVDARKNNELALERAAQHDPLTGLGNRAQLFERVAFLLNPPSNDAAGLLFVDLDGFKAVNDKYGHEVGDAVLIEVAARLRDTVRPADVAVRLGGDEFVVVCALPAAATDRFLRVLAARVEAVIATPVQHGHLRINIGCSVGVAIAPAGQDLQALLDAADRDMYVRKRERRAAGGATAL